MKRLNDFVNYLNSLLNDNEIVIVGGLSFIDYDNDVLFNSDRKLMNCYVFNSVKLSSNVLFMEDVLEVINDNSKIEKFIIKHYKRIKNDIKLLEDIIFSKNNNGVVIFTDVINYMIPFNYLISLDNKFREIKDEKKLLNSILDTNNKYLKFMSKLNKYKYKEIKFILNSYLFNNKDEYVNYVINKYDVDGKLIRFNFLEFLYSVYAYNIFIDGNNININKLLFK